MYKEDQPSAPTHTHEGPRVPREPLRILRWPAAINRVGLSRASIYNRIRAGCFPRAVSLGGRSVGFVEHEIDDWLSAAAHRRFEAQPLTNKGHQ